MGLLDIDDPNTINTTNLLENGWKYSVDEDHWVKNFHHLAGLRKAYLVYKKNLVSIKNWADWLDLSQQVNTIGELNDFERSQLRRINDHFDDLFGYSS